MSWQPRSVSATWSSCAPSRVGDVFPRQATAKGGQHRDRPQLTIQMDGDGMVCAMADNVHELRPKAGDTEKITINLGHVDLGHIDLMVQDGFYSNRTDFIRTAIRNQLDRHAEVVKQSVARKSLELGLRHYSREALEAVR